MKKGKINIIIDGQWGSTGKGKFVGYLALKHKPHIAVCNFMTNAGHTFVWEDGTSMLFQQIPVSAVNKSTTLVLASSSAITLHTLFNEIEQLEKLGLSVNDRLFIDEKAIIIDKKHCEKEAENIKYIASTMKGCGYALADKIMRNGNVKLASDVTELREYIIDAKEVLNSSLELGKTVIGETAQGFDLSLNHGTSYPFVTSRDVTPMQFLNDCGLSSEWLGDVYGVIRTYPIRVGNVVENGIIKGVSGGFYSDQKELTWEMVSNMSGKSLVELTSVTKRVRRVFTFSSKQYEKFIRICRPTKTCINFVNYFNGITSESDIDDLVKNKHFMEFATTLHRAERKVLGKEIEISLMGIGSKNNEIISNTYSHDLPFFARQED